MSSYHERKSMAEVNISSGRCYYISRQICFYLLCLKSICLVVITSCRLIILILKFQTLSKGNNPQTTERNPLELNLITFDQ